MTESLTTDDLVRVIPLAAWQRIRVFVAGKRNGTITLCFHAGRIQSTEYKEHETHRQVR